MSAPFPPVRDSGVEPGSVDRLETGYSPLRIFAWAGLVGVGAGLVGALFRVLLHSLAERRLVSLGPSGPRALSLALSIGSTAVMTSAALFLVRRYAPEASGSGVPWAWDWSSAARGRRFKWAGTSER